MKITRILANNPGMFTGRGTNTWVLTSGGRSAIIDPGPALADHQEAIREAIAGTEPIVILVTHCHLDHVESANALAAELGVPLMGGCPGPAFKPDRVVADGDTIEVGEVALEVIGTPGHTAHHVCYRAGDALFTGDHIMGGSSVIVEHMSEYLQSLQKIRGTGLTMLYPGHGEAMEDPDEVIDWYVEHRLEREQQIIAALDAGARTIGDIVEHCYEDVDAAFYAMAGRSVGAHLRKLAAEGRVGLPHGSSDWSSRIEYPVAGGDDA
ncbi:MAG: MBL fold metallo-hydrolase [Actinobacteria bacterium]|nr:MBL fold metallo-hydrolase [Actinomycetota bacterium]